MDFHVFLIKKKEKKEWNVIIHTLHSYIIHAFLPLKKKAKNVSVYLSLTLRSTETYMFYINDAVISLESLSLENHPCCWSVYLWKGVIDWQWHTHRAHSEQLHGHLCVSEHVLGHHAIISLDLNYSPFSTSPIQPKRNTHYICYI